MRNYKTSKANRATYRYYDIEGKLRCELVPGQDGVTEVFIQQLHAADDEEYGDATFTGGSYVKPDTATTEYTLGTRTLKKGSKGSDVKALQEFLLQLEYSLPRYGADGKFGTETEAALKVFQKKANIKQDGIYGSETHQALMDAVADDDDGKAPTEPGESEMETSAVKQVRIVCSNGSVNIRVGNDTKYSRITSVKDGATFEWVATSENGWHAVVVNARVGWVSGKYSKIV